MSTEMAIWRIDEGEKAQPLSLGGIDFENKLENVIENDPSTIDPNLLVIGRQVRTDGGPIDLLAIDPEGRLVVIELKRNKTSREVIAQALDYGSSLRDKAEEEIKEIFTQYQLSRGVSQPEEIYAALEKRFGGSPDELNRSPRLLIVAARVDPATERIVRYLQDEYKANIDVVFFHAFQDGEHQYLARASMGEPEASTSRKSSGDWNGEYYANFEEGDSRLWAEAKEYGFICAGGGEWYVRTLGMLELGARVWVSVPGRGYVGVGKVVTTAAHYNDFTLKIDGSDTPITEVGLKAENAFNEDHGEHFVGVEWIEAFDLKDAVKEPGFFGNQNTVARPRSPKWNYTVERLKTLWRVD